MFRDELLDIGEIKPIKGIFSETDEIIIEKLLKTCEPINLIIPELKEKRKDWMTDDDRNDYGGLFNSTNGYQLFDKDELEEMILGYSIDNDDVDDGESEYYFELDEFLDSRVYFFVINWFWSGRGNIDVKEKFTLIHNIKKKLLEVFWSSFNIDENLIEIFDFYRERIRHKQEDLIDETSKKRWKSYQRAYFYSKDNVKRAASIFLKFNIQRQQLLNGSNGKDKEVKVDLTDQGFVYFIRNKDLYKIGITQNLLRRLKQLKPDEVLNTVRCRNFKKLEKKLHNSFKENRIPQTEYFRLTSSQVEEVNRIMLKKAKL